MPKNHDIIEVEATLVSQTENAFLLDNGGHQKIWVPKSLVEYDGDGVFQMPEWLAENKGLI